MTIVRILALACAALALAGCALAPETKTFYLSHGDWSGTVLSARGEQTVADSVAGAAPNTITILNIGALETAPRGPSERLAAQEERARAVTAALMRRRAAPTAIAIEILAMDAPEPLWPPSKPIVVVVR